MRVSPLGSAGETDLAVKPAFRLSYAAAFTTELLTYVTQLASADFLRWMMNRQPTFCWSTPGVSLRARTFGGRTLNVSSRPFALYVQMVPGDPLVSVSEWLPTRPTCPFSVSAKAVRAPARSVSDAARDTSTESRRKRSTDIICPQGVNRRMV